MLTLQLFKTPDATSVSGHGDLVSVSDDQLICLDQEMLVLQDCIDLVPFARSSKLSTPICRRGKVSANLVGRLRRQ